MSLQEEMNQSPTSSPKIELRIHQRPYGKPTKCRGDEPSMFQLLTWENNSLNRNDFKKNNRFRQIPEAYMQQIEKEPWTSESKENYITPDGSIPVNETTMYRVENYMHNRLTKENAKQPCQQQCLETQNKSQKNAKQPVRSNKNIEETEQKANKANYNNAKRNYSPQIEGNREKKPAERLHSPQPNISNGKLNKYNKNIFGYQENDQNEVTEEQQLKQRKKLIEKFNQTTRWIPNSAFTTYFGKPPFENYGYGNVRPTKGGLVYGTYLYSHNVHPHRGMNSPKSLQSYPVALNKAQSQGVLVPFPPKTKNPDLNTSDDGNDAAKKFSSINIYPEPNTTGPLQIQKPNLMEIQKFGGCGISRGSITQSRVQSHAQAEPAAQKPKKKKGIMTGKKTNESQNHQYEDWVMLKEEQNKGYNALRPASAKQGVSGRKVQY